MIAFKCDNCGEYHDGEPVQIHDYMVDGFVVAVAVGINSEPKEEEPTNLNLPSGDDYLSFLARSVAESKPKQHAADLCEGCRSAIVESAIRKAAMA